MVTTGSSIEIETVLKVDLPGNSRDSNSLANLKPGDVLKGKVMKNGASGGTAVARFGGRNVPLPNASNLTPGQPVTAEVVKVSYQLRLRAVPPDIRSQARQGTEPFPKSGSGNALTLTLNLPESIKSGNVLSMARPGDIITGVVVKPLGQNQAIIRIDGVDILSTSSKSLSMGETITARVERTLPQVTLKVLQESFLAKSQGILSGALSGRPIPDPFQESTIKLSPNQLRGGLTLKEGQLTEVNVLRLLSGNKAVYDVAGKLVEAAAFKGAEAGKTLFMSVDSLSPELVLKSVNPNPEFNMEKAAAFIREFLPGRESMDKVLDRLVRLVADEKLPGALKSDKGLLDGLRQALNESVIPKPDGQSANLIRRAVGVSGQSYESNIKTALEIGVSPEEINNTLLKGDLKGELLKLETLVNERLAMLKGGSQETQATMQELRSFGNSIRASLNQIELNQVMNAVNHREGSTVSFQVPFVTSDGKTKNLEVFVKKNRKEKGGRGGEEKESCNVTLLLDMTSLGPLRVDMYLRKNSLQGKIVTQDKEVAEFMKIQLPLLESSLSELGYASKLECSVTREEKLVGPVISEKTPIKKLGLLDVTV